MKIIFSIIRLLATTLFSLGVAHAQTISAQVIGVSDGDTITVLTEDKQRIRIRLSEIDAPESRQAFGQVSKQALSDLCYRKTAAFDPNNKDRYGRVVSRVSCDGVDAQSYMVSKGMAWVYTRYSKDPSLKELERAAKARRFGLWQDPNPVPPWEFRRKK